jgi:hypothetical protein
LKTQQSRAEQPRRRQKPTKHGTARRYTTCPKTAPPRRERRPWHHRHPIQADFGLSPGTGVGGKGMRPQWRLTRSQRPKGVAATVVKDGGFLPVPACHTHFPAINHRYERYFTLLRQDFDQQLLHLSSIALSYRIKTCLAFGMEGILHQIELLDTTVIVHMPICKSKGTVACLALLCISIATSLCSVIIYT